MTYVDGTGLEVSAPLVSILRCRLCGVEALRFDPSPCSLSWRFGNANMRPLHPFGVARHACGDWRVGVLEEVGFLYAMPDDLDALVWVSVSPDFGEVGVPMPLRDVWPTGAGGEGQRVTVELAVEVDDAGLRAFMEQASRLAADSAAAIAAYAAVLAAEASS